MRPLAYVDAADELRSYGHPCGVDPTIAEVWRVMWLELTFGPPGNMLDVCARVAVALGARADGALRERLHGPVRPLDGSSIAANGRRP